MMLPIRKLLLSVFAAVAVFAAIPKADAAPAFVQQAAASSAAANSQAAGPITPGSGDLLAVVFHTSSITSVTFLSISDGGVGNTYRPAPGALAPSASGTAVTFAAAPTGTSQALNTTFAGTTGSYAIVFSDGEIRVVTLTNGSSACSWSGTPVQLFNGPLTGFPTTSATAYASGTGALIGLYAQNVSAAATTVTLSQSTGLNLDGLYVGDYSGIAASGAFLGGVGVRQNGSGTVGANLLTTPNVSGVSGTSLLFGFAFDFAGSLASTAGTSPTAFTGRTPVWTASVPEDSLVTSNVAATWGTNSTDAYDSFYLVAMAFSPSGAAGAALAGAASDATSATGAILTTPAPFVPIVLNSASHLGGSTQIGLGTGPNTGTGDSAYVVFPKIVQDYIDINTMFAQLYPVRSFQIPTTGFSIAASSGPPAVTQLMLNPAGTLATGTVTLPQHPADNQPFGVMTSQTISALTVNTADGTTLNGAPNTLSANAGAKWRFVTSVNTWYREQ